MSLVSRLKIIAAYVVLGPPIGLLTLVLAIAVKGPIGIPSWSILIWSIRNEVPIALLAGYAFGFIPAVASGLAHVFAQTRLLRRSQTIALVSACGVAANIPCFLGLVNLGGRDWQSVLFLMASTLVAPPLIAAVCVSVLLTRGETSDTI